MPRTIESIVADALRAVLISPDEADRDLEPANVVDAIDFHGRCVGEGLDGIAKSLDRLTRLAVAIDNVADKLADTATRIEELR